MIDWAVTVDVLNKFVDTLYLNNSMKNFYESVVPVNIESLMSDSDIFEISVTLIFSGNKRIFLTNRSNQISRV